LKYPWRLKTASLKSLDTDEIEDKLGADNTSVINGLEITNCDIQFGAHQSEKPARGLKRE
jgi:hypothetical protein